MIASVVTLGWGEVLTAAGVIVSGLGLFLGIPQWRMQRRALAVERKADLNHELLEAARQVLVGNEPYAPPSRDNPSLLDLLKDLRELIKEQAEMSAIVAHHLSDGHGGELPPWLRPGWKP